MPVDTCPELLEGLSPALKKRMQGRSCFNFRTVGPEEAHELDGLTRRSVRRFRAVARLRPGRQAAGGQGR